MEPFPKIFSIISGNREILKEKMEVRNGIFHEGGGSPRIPSGACQSSFKFEWSLQKHVFRDKF